MTLVDQLKQLESGDRRPVVNPEEVPCRETSDAERLCKHPVVSVVMVTYNHEPYIRQTIESVLCQKSDFEYELIIGEDCSTDKTREICFEYQKRFPDKVRVLWADRNLYQLGLSNERRCIDHCRGEYIAFCEGDDYWTDPLKLQKQVDLIRQKDAVMCVAFNHVIWPSGVEEDALYERKEYLTVADFKKHYFQTSTYLISGLSYRKMCEQSPGVRCWFDILVEFHQAAMGRVCLLPEIVSTYRKTGNGICSSLNVAERKFESAKMEYAMFLYGPQSLRGYFANNVMVAVDELFTTNRRYRPYPMAWRTFKELVCAHFYLARVFRIYPECKVIPIHLYALSIGYYWLRLLLTGIGLGGYLKKMKGELWRVVS